MKNFLKVNVVFMAVAVLLTAGSCKLPTESNGGPPPEAAVSGTVRLDSVKIELLPKPHPSDINRYVQVTGYFSGAQGGGLSKIEKWQEGRNDDWSDWTRAFTVTGTESGSFTVKSISDAGVKWRIHVYDKSGGSSNTVEVESP